MDATISALIVQQATAQGVDPNLALAVAQKESGGDQNALSPKGAVGVFQLMPSSFPGVNIWDLQTNIQTGIAYIRQLSAQYGNDLQKVLAAYNWGPGNVSSAVAQGGSNWFLNIPSSVQQYVSSILSSVGSGFTSIASSAFGDAISSGLPSASSAVPWLLLAAGAIAVFVFAD